jgi:hypothetical protein
MNDETLIGILCSIGGLIIGVALGSVITLERYDEVTRKLEVAKKVAILTKELANAVSEYKNVQEKNNLEYNSDEEE